MLIITGLSMGGAEMVVTRLADALIEKGHIVRLVYMTGFATVVPNHRSAQVTGLAITSKLRFLAAFFKLRTLIFFFQPSVVHSHMVHANIFARLVRLITPIPLLISTAHSSNEGGNLRMLAYRLTDSLADISTNVSAQAVEVFEKRNAVKPGRMISVHNGICTSSFFFDSTTRQHTRSRLGVSEPCRLILAVGRLHEAKDYANLFQALKVLQTTGFNFKMCIAGDGPLRRQLEALVLTLGLYDCVEFLGVRHDVPALMSAADVFVLSSAWEGFGLVVAEAMACERVVVATDCGGVREVLGNTGFLVPPRDPIALADALQSALSLSANEADAMGRAARQRVIEHFSLDAAVEKWLKIYAGDFSVAAPLAVNALN